MPRPDELAVAFEDGALTVRRWRGRVGPAARRGADGFLAALRGLATGLGLDGESDADEAYDEAAAPQKKVKPIRVNLWASWCLPCLAESASWRPTAPNSTPRVSRCWRSPPRRREQRLGAPERRAPSPSRDARADPGHGLALAETGGETELAAEIGERLAGYRRGETATS